jgi:signal transduction histidine kinase
VLQARRRRDDLPDTMRVWSNRLLHLALGATGLGLAAATWLYVATRLVGDGTPFSQVARLVMPFWYLWAAFTPAVLWMAARYPIRRGHLPGGLAWHMACALSMAFTHTAMRVALQPQLRASLQAGPGAGFDPGTLLAFATYEAPVHVFIYGAILGAIHVVESTRRLRERELVTARLSAQLARAQIQALRMQLNPHFLFNALNGVAMLVREGQQDRAVRMLADLGELLRRVLDASEDQEVPLASELELIRRYLEIERIRFEDRLRVRINVDPAAATALVPNLILQPIVENAVRHGIARRADASEVRILVQRSGNILRVRVEDDGPGIAQGADCAKGGGMGIENTRDRLAQLYGADYSLALESLYPTGAAVTITLPFRSAAPRKGED